MSRLTPETETMLDAASANDIATVWASLKRGAEVRAVRDGGYSALHYACRDLSIQLVELLLQYGADPNHVAHPRGETPLYITTLRLSRGAQAFTIVEILATAGAKLNQPDCEDNLPLHLVVKDGPLPLIEHLLKCGADVNARNSLGNTPLHVACHPATWQPPEIIDLLIQRGARLSPDLCRDLLSYARKKSERNHRDAFVSKLEALSSKQPTPPATQEIKFSFRCPTCNASLTASEPTAGLRGKCPKCAKECVIPSLDLLAKQTASQFFSSTDPDEPRTWQILANVSKDQWLQRFPDYDVAYLRLAYPTGNSGDHSNGASLVLLQGLSAAKRKSWLLGRLAAYSAWRGEAESAFRYAVSSLLTMKATTSDSPGDNVGAANLLQAVFRSTPHINVAERLNSIFPSFVESEEMQQRFRSVATELAKLPYQVLVYTGAELISKKFNWPTRPPAVPQKASTETSKPANTPPTSKPPTKVNVPTPPPKPTHRTNTVVKHGNEPLPSIKAQLRISPQKHLDQPIVAIKVLRSVTGLGLLDAKKIIDTCSAGGTIEIRIPASEKIDDQIREIAAVGLEIQLIAPPTNTSLPDRTRPPIESRPTAPVVPTLPNGEKITTATLHLSPIQKVDLVQTCKLLRTSTGASLMDAKQTADIANSGKPIRVKLPNDARLRRWINEFRALGFDVEVAVDNEN